MFVRVKYLWERKLWCRSGMQFSGRSLFCQGNWAYLENRPHCALTSVDKSQTKHLLLYHFLRAKIGIILQDWAKHPTDVKYWLHNLMYGAPRCHVTLSILSITHGNHMKG